MVTFGSSPRSTGPFPRATCRGGRCGLGRSSSRCVTSAGNYIFPLYLNNVSDLHRIGGTIGFILIAMVWFYAISLALLAGAVINSLRHERDDTGTLPLDG